MLVRRAAPEGEELLCKQLEAKPASSTPSGAAKTIPANTGQMSYTLALYGRYKEKWENPGGPMQRQPADRTFALGLYQNFGDQAPWVSIGTKDDSGMELSLETAARFAEALAELVNEAR